MGQWIDRREFLGAGAAAALVPSVLGAAAPSGQSPAARRMKIAVKYGMIGGGGSALEKFEILRRAGFDGVEVDSPGSVDIDELLKARDMAGIVVPGVVDSVHWQKTLGDADANVRGESRRALETALRECKSLGGTSVLLVPAVVNQSISYDAAYERSQAEIARVLPLAAELQVHIAIENVWNNFLLSPLEAARYTDELNSPWIGWHFDPGNIVNYGWPEQWIRILGKRILKLDVKEFSRRKRDEQGLWKGFDVEIGEGDCDWTAIRKALDEVGYTDSGGWACAEVRGGDEARLRDLAQRMNRVLGNTQ
jgi:hexulose-6-phosphate isomerase